VSGKEVIMMFNANLVAVVKANGKVLREDRSANTAPTVYLPFKSEYSILLKNLHARKARVLVSIDGQDVLGGRALVLQPNTEIELERFISDNNLNEGNKFLFIEKTKQISDFRGDKVDDGILRIEYQFEQAPPPIATWIYNNNSFPNNIYNTRIGSSADCDGGAGLNTVYGSSVSEFTASCCAGVSYERETKTGGNLLRSKNIDVMSDHYTPVSDDGITVKGSKSNQQFKAGHIGALEMEKHVITLILRGETATKKVTIPIIVQAKATCETCGTTYRGFPKFCSNCGTAMNVV
jgi:hypothetical protein